MDETSIRLYQKPGKGCVVKVARKEKRSAKSLTRNVTKGQLLGTFTHVAMICDDADLQPHLPQFLFINQTQISQAEFESIQGEWLPNVHARRVANPWMTNDKIKVVLKGLADAVAANSQNRRVVLLQQVRGNLLQHITSSTSLSRRNSLGHCNLATLTCSPCSRICCVRAAKNLQFSTAAAAGTSPCS